jgi:hypothetical protein
VLCLHVANTLQFQSEAGAAIFAAGGSVALAVVGVARLAAGVVVAVVDGRENSAFPDKRIQKRFTSVPHFMGRNELFDLGGDCVNLSAIRTRMTSHVHFAHVTTALDATTLEE